MKLRHRALLIAPLVILMVYSWLFAQLQNAILYDTSIYPSMLGNLINLLQTAYVICFAFIVLLLVQRNPELRLPKFSAMVGFYTLIAIALQVIFYLQINSASSTRISVFVLTLTISILMILWFLFLQFLRKRQNQQGS